MTATWPRRGRCAARTRPLDGNPPAAGTYTADTVDKIATVKFNFYNQVAQPVVTFATTPSNSVTNGTAVTVSATVKDQFGNPIPGQRVTFLVTGPNQSSCNPTNNTSIAARLHADQL